ncbi:MAG: hypothetical protein K6D38_09200 [Pseudobutyrivibrio sp.]|nr:hypothetical protein [Pseudobutyrivibrio sp.]
MNKTLKTVLIIIVLIAVVIIYGCVRNHISEVQRKNYKLNARQVAILKEEEMPTEWDELNSYQQDCIKSIEDMLEYLEKKYDKEFCYGGYRAADWMDNEQEELLAYAKGDDRETDCFAVRPTKKGFEDDYPTVYLWPEYVEKYSKQIKDIVGDAKFVCFPIIGENDGKKAKHTSIDIVISYTDDYKKVGETIYKKLLTNEEDVGRIVIYVTDSEYIEKMTFANWKEILDEDNIIDHFNNTERSGERIGGWEE